MKYLYLLIALYLLIGCRKEKEDKNPMAIFTPTDEFVYKNEDSLYVVINSISSRPMQKTQVSLVVDSLGMDSVFAEFKIDDELERFGDSALLYLDTTWTDSLDIRLKVTITDEKQTKFQESEGLYRN